MTAMTDMPAGEGAEPTADAERDGGPTLRLVPLVFGLAFMVLGGTAIAADLDRIDVDPTWLWVIGLGSLGVAGIVSTIAGLARGRSG